ncbi:hypothetical protein AV656_13140 [Bhargavaea cecembensis]|uniref:Uncharacterized protein n=1 Tax=Bhargavaea cecembensis TaxID=394098 RepID=A0A163EYD5_9BACL|nr:immunity protein YezG family protein [Bhargavaea cecembensis]KZE37501.1 hypothetical protein AV656_13140 [Bhargavaea cecembensis]
MTDEKLNLFYQQIADTVIEMIPEKWTLVKLYAEMWDDFSTIYFYYFPDNGAEPVLSLSISRLFEVDRDEYTRLKRMLRKQIGQLQDEFMANSQEPWTNFTLWSNVKPGRPNMGLNQSRINEYTYQTTSKGEF